VASLFDLRGFLRRTRPRQALLRGLGPWALLVGGAIAIELYARRADSIPEEIVAVAAFSVLAYHLWRRTRDPLLASPLIARCRSWVLARRVRFGVDLRGEPPLPSRLPGPQSLVFVSVLVLDAALLLTRELWSRRAIEALRGASGLLATGFTATLWAVLLVGILSALLLPVMLADARLRERRIAGRHREVVLLWIGAGNALGLLVLALLLPPWVALAAAFSGVVSGAWLYLPADPPLRFAWKRRIDGAAATLAAPLWLAGWRLFHFGLFLALVLVASGSVLGGVHTSPGLTELLGLVLAWSMAGASMLLAVREGWHGWRARLANPARPLRYRILVAGDPDEALRDQVRRHLEPAGFEVRFDPGPCDAAIEIAAEDGPAEWPRRVSPLRLSDPELHRQLRRRAEHQARRRLRRGLKRLFALADVRRRKLPEGIGHWIAPHLWFVLHMGRDGQDELETVGPPYHDLLPRSARHHLFVVLEALDVDLIFVEDGVGFRRFQRVLAMTFEFHDMFGTRSLEERHFQGLPGIRVLIEELCLDEPLRASRYPEPDYEQLARARILHVFRDRGADPDRERPRPRIDRRPLADLFL